MTDTLLALVIMLGLASLAAMLSRRLGMGTILGLLLAGMVAGPHGLALVRDVGALRHWSKSAWRSLLVGAGLSLSSTAMVL